MENLKNNNNNKVKNKRANKIKKVLFQKIVNIIRLETPIFQILVMSNIQINYFLVNRLICP